MENTNYIEIIFEGNKGSEKLTPLNYDIKEVKKFLDVVELFFEKDRGTITFAIEAGSVKHKLFVPIAFAVMFNASVAFINNGEESKVPQNLMNGFRKLSDICRQSNYEATIKTSVSNTNLLRVDKDTKFKNTSNNIVMTEFNFIGEIVDAGGKSNPNIHLDTAEYGVLTIKSDKEYLSNFSENLLYKKFSVMAQGLADLQTGEPDKTTLQLISMQEFNPVYNEAKFADHFRQTSSNWNNVEDIDSWLDLVRGYDEFLSLPIISLRN